MTVQFEEKGTRYEEKEGGFYVFIFRNYGA